MTDIHAASCSYLHTLPPNQYCTCGAAERLAALLDVERDNFKTAVRASQNNAKERDEARAFGTDHMQRCTKLEPERAALQARLDEERKSREAIMAILEKERADFREMDDKTSVRALELADEGPSGRGGTADRGHAAYRGSRVLRSSLCWLHPR